MGVQYGQAEEEEVSVPKPVQPQIVHTGSSVCCVPRPFCKRGLLDIISLGCFSGEQSFNQVLPNLLGGERALCWQAHPTMRVILPSEEPVGVPHCDHDYRHPRSEINIWVPLTKVLSRTLWNYYTCSSQVQGSNTLWTESEPSLGDYHPLVSTVKMLNRAIAKTE